MFILIWIIYFLQFIFNIHCIVIRRPYSIILWWKHQYRSFYIFYFYKTIRGNVFIFIKTNDMQLSIFSKYSKNIECSRFIWSIRQFFSSIAPAGCSGRSFIFFPAYQSLTDKIWWNTYNNTGNIRKHGCCHQCYFTSFWCTVNSDFLIAFLLKPLYSIFYIFNRNSI